MIFGNNMDNSILIGGLEKNNSMVFKYFLWCIRDWINRVTENYQDGNQNSLGVKFGPSSISSIPFLINIEGNDKDIGKGANPSRTILCTWDERDPRHWRMRRENLTRLNMFGLWRCILIHRMSFQRRSSRGTVIVQDWSVINEMTRNYSIICMTRIITMP